MSSSPPPYEIEDRPVLNVGEQGATMPANNDTEATSAVKNNKQADAVSANKKTYICTSEKRDAEMIQKSRDVRTRMGFNWLQNTAGDSNISCFSIICPIFIVVIFICLRFYPISTPSVVQINNGGNITHDLQPLEKFVSTGAINGSIIQDPKREVFPGTREKVLTQIKNWIDNPNPAEHILWLHGPAGVGKSAIAQTITNYYTTEKVAANFFFFRYDPDRNDGYRLITTLAWQFTSSIPVIKDHIARSLIEEPDLPTKDLEIQFQELIVRPFEALSDHAHQFWLPDKVVIIDGIDECVDTSLQERILKLIGDIATNPRVPLRFLISSRPENHLNGTITSFQPHTLSIDLANCEDADRDIDKYFKGNFNKIAKYQGIHPVTWPSKEMMQRLVYRASGQFLYASTVIRFVGEEDHFAKTQLDIILGLKLHKAIQPFAELDSLYIGILERLSNKELLKTLLALLIAKHSINTNSFVEYWSNEIIFGSFCVYTHLRDGYGILLGLSEQELRIKLRGMRSLLNISPDYVGFHHISFLEFLQDPSRSGQYHISKEKAAGQYVMLVIDSVVRSANESLRISEHPDYYPTVPKAVKIFTTYPSNLDDMLSREDWQEALRRLEKFQDKLHHLPNFTTPRNENTIFDVVHRLQLAISYRQLSSALLSKAKENQDATMLSPVQNLDVNFFPPLEYFHIKGMFDLVNTLLHVDPEMIVRRVRSWLEAQNLMYLAYHIVNGEHFATNLSSTNVARQASQLAMELYIRVPVLPQIHFFRTLADFLFYLENGSVHCIPKVLSRVWISHFLDHRYIFPLLKTNIVFKHGKCGISHISDDIGIPIHQWRTSTNPSSNEILFAMLKLARAIQYLNSMGIMLSNSIGIGDIYVDLRFRVRISPVELVWTMYDESLQEVGKRCENSIDKFGEFFCTIYFNTELSCTTATSTSVCKPESGVRADVWQLIERCLSGEGKPSINEVIQEIESWTVES